jgi:hypothetical protein
MTGVIIWIILIALAALLLWMIINKKMSGGGGNFAATSALGDLQNEEKRNALETVIEEKAGKKRFGQTSGAEQEREEKKPKP